MFHRKDEHIYDSRNYIVFIDNKEQVEDLLKSTIVEITLSL